MATDRHCSRDGQSATRWGRERWSLSQVHNCLARILFPSGYVVAFLGPDGAGKTTVMTEVKRDLASHFPDSRSIHLRIKLLGGQHRAVPVTDPHGKPDRSTTMSLLKLIYYVVEYVVGYHTVIRVLRTSGQLVFFDRYFDDLYIDPHRFRLAAPTRIVRLLGRLVPRPDCTIVLDAPVEVLQSRKAEVTWEEASRQREAYRTLARDRNSVILVDATAPPQEVSRIVTSAILLRLARRTAILSSHVGGH